MLKGLAAGFAGIAVIAGADPDVDSAEKTQRDLATKELALQVRSTEADEGMVELTTLMLWLAGAQLVLGIAGTAGLLISLRFTASAAKEAAAAARASEKATELAADTAQRQLRAYVDVHSAHTVQYGFGVGLAARMTIKNSGATPAHQASANYTIVIGGPIPEYGGIRLEPRDMPAGGESLLEHCTEPLNGDQVGALDAGTLKALFIGRIDYTDAFGEDRQTHIRLQFDPLTRQWRPDVEGNYTT